MSELEDNFGQVQFCIFVGYLFIGFNLNLVFFFHRVYPEAIKKKIDNLTYKI